MTTPGLEPDIQCSNDAVDQPSQNTMAAILRGLNDTLAQLTKASEKQTATLTSLKDDILLRPESDEEAEKEDSNMSNTQLNSTATLDNVLDPSDSCVVKESAGSDSEKQNDVLESLTQAFVQTNDKSPAITEKVASLIDNMASGGLSPETVKERVDKYPPPENCKFLCTTTINEEVWDLLPRRSRTVDLAFQKVQELLVQGLSSLSILGDQLVKDLQTGKPTNVRQVLDQVMDSIALVANAKCNYKLNMKRRELIKPDLNPPFTRLCKEDIKPSTKLFGDELSKHLKDMADAKKAGQQMQRTSDTRTSSHNYLKAGRQKFRRSNFKPYHWTSTGQKTSQTRPFLGYSRGHKSAPKKPSQSNNKD